MLSSNLLFPACTRPAPRQKSIMYSFSRRKFVFAWLVKFEIYFTFEKRQRKAFNLGLSVERGSFVIGELNEL